MEVKINKEIRNYSESIFFGLSLRQLIFSISAIGVAVILYFIISPFAGIETISWVCILGASPFAAIGFISYHGMTAEKFIWAWIKSEISTPKKLVFTPRNIYYIALKETISFHEKEGIEEAAYRVKFRDYCTLFKDIVRKILQKLSKNIILLKDSIIRIFKKIKINSPTLTKEKKHD